MIVLLICYQIKKYNARNTKVMYKLSKYNNLFLSILKKYEFDCAKIKSYFNLLQIAD